MPNHNLCLSLLIIACTIAARPALSLDDAGELPAAARNDDFLYYLRL
jgi:hypothetical protein